MVSRRVVVKNPTGLHLRPAGILCNEAVKYKCSVCFRYGINAANEANAKSVLSVLGAGVRCGAELEFVCDGEDEEAALAALVAAVENGLGE